MCSEYFVNYIAYNIDESSRNFFTDLKKLLSLVNKLDSKCY